VIPLRVALVVQGRFHAFDLARALSQRGHDVTIFTTYPAWAVRRFDIGRARVRSCWTTGVIARVLGRLRGVVRPEVSETWLHRRFGRWAARAIRNTTWDVVHCWSGVSEELLRSSETQAGCTLLMRGSAHIAVQDAILREEETRSGVRLVRPSPWMIERESREYLLADRVVVLSSFARRTFERESFPSHRVLTLPLGVDVLAFRAPATVVGARDQRIRSGSPLRVLYVGTLSLRKGLLDLEAALERLPDVPLEIRLIGAATPEVAGVLGRLGTRVTHVPAMPQIQLPAEYWASDLFVFPTLEDGFGLVLTQAKAAGLPILCTTNCAGPDLVHQDEDGWIVPVRSPEAIAATLRWCHTHRDRLAEMAQAAATTFRPKDWAGVAEAFEAMVRDVMAPLATRAHSA
jgi:glycosyltransferase involved in cell wall biosynthesis